MPAKSEAQRRLFGMVLAARRGQLKKPSAEVDKVADSVTDQQAADFATKKKRPAGGMKSAMPPNSGY